MAAGFASDAPEQDFANDRLNRATFARRVAEVLAGREDPASLVVGIYGAWGEGKTTVLGFVRAALQSHDKVIVVSFNPWRFGDESTLLREFYRSMADGIGVRLNTKQEELAAWAADNAKFLKALTVGPVSGDGLADTLGELAAPRVDELRRRIEAILEGADKRVVVLLDDLDRLEPREVHAVLRLVKLNADFRHVSYILACDERVVAEALAIGMGGLKRAWGHGFLHKIVQVPLHLPAADRRVLADLLFEGIGRALESVEVELDDDQARDLSWGLSTCVLPAIVNIRQCKRYENAITFALPLLLGEVRESDLLLVEAMRVFYPKLYEWIRKNPDTVMDALAEGRDRSQEIDERRRSIEAALKLVAPDVRGYARDLVALLFPRTEVLIGGGASYGWDFNPGWSREKRVCAEDYFPRYFAYGIPLRDVSDKRVEDVLALAASDSAELASAVAVLLTEERAGRFIEKLLARADVLGATQAQRIGFAIAEGSASLRNAAMELPWSGNLDRAGYLITQLMRPHSMRTRREVLLGVMDTASSLAFANEVLERFRWSNEGENEDKGRLVEREVEELALARLVARIRNASGEVGLMNTSGQEAVALWRRVKDTDGPDAVWKLVEAELDRWPIAIYGLLQGVAARSFGGRGPMGVDFDKEQFEQIAKVLPGDMLLRYVEARYGDEVAGAEHDDRTARRKQSDNARLIRGFVRAARAAAALGNKSPSENEEPPGNG